jgi:hypothetical protein
LEGIGLIEKIEKNKIRWKAGNIDELQLFNADLPDFDLDQMKNLPSTPALYYNLPQGIGKNGIVFKTKRLFDPKHS